MDKMNNEISEDNTKGIVKAFKSKLLCNFKPDIQVSYKIRIILYNKGSY